ncbi:MAG: DUF2344 domain-containing protein [Planctomycetes bacterium]|nr:DUF2344 domain-containing protein [Planctomycetota bacterium]
MERERVRVRYSKTGDLRFLSHLDLVRTWERALRRTGLDLVFTDGFNPRLRLSFSGALPTGWESHAEYVELQLAEDHSSEELCRRISAVLPRGLSVRGVDRHVTKSDRPRAATVSFAVYRHRDWPPSPAELERRLGLLAAEMREEIRSCRLVSGEEGRELLAGGLPPQVLSDRSREVASAVSLSATAQDLCVLRLELLMRIDGGHLRLDELLTELIEPGPKVQPLRILKLAFRPEAREEANEHGTEAGSGEGHPRLEPAAQLR